MGKYLPNVVVVLNDGETYTNVEGCKVLVVPDSVSGEPEEEFWVKDNFELGIDLSDLVEGRLWGKPSSIT